MEIMKRIRHILAILVLDSTIVQLFLVCLLDGEWAPFRCMIDEFRGQTLAEHFGRHFDKDF